MKPIELSRNDVLCFRFTATGVPVAREPALLNGFLDALEAHAGDWMPTHVQKINGRERQYSRGAVFKSFEEKQPDPPLLYFYFERPPFPELSLSLNLYERLNTTSIHGDILPFSFFQNTAHTEARSRGLVELIRAWACWHPPQYAFAHSSGDIALSPDPHRYGGLGFGEQMHEIYWLNVLGKDLVTRFGRERVLSTPAHRVEELPGGSVLIQTRPTVADVTSDEARLAQARALSHLRPEFPFDEVLARLRARTAALVPVAPQFHPDLAYLMEYLLDREASFGERPQRTAAFNAYRPPEVSEWLPRSSAPSSDVPDAAAQVERYRTLHAERLVALVHTEHPEVFEGGPESLPLIDRYLWEKDYHRHRTVAEMEPLVLAVGAYLGEVMVHHLGGRWVPRKNHDESHVLLGDRAWLPFVRARHCLPSRQMVLDYSLNHFYRTAERAVRAV